MIGAKGLAKVATRNVSQQIRNAVTVTGLKAREVIDSRGNPTVEVDVHTSAGMFRGIFLQYFLFLSLMQSY